jgi:regulator of replication initiation timing
MYVKRKALAFILIMVIALSVASWLVYDQISELQNQVSELQVQNDELQEQNGELQEQNSDLQDLINNQIRELQEQFNESYKNSPVRIVAVNYLGGFSPVVRGIIASDVHVTVLNNYTSALSGLTLTTKFLDSTGNVSGLINTYQIDELQAGESLEIDASVWWHLDRSRTTLVVTLKFANLVIDQSIQRFGI